MLKTRKFATLSAGLLSLLIIALVADQLEVGATEAAVTNIATDGDPGSVVIATANIDAGRHDVEKAREFIAYPRSAIVLVGDGVDTELGDELRKLVL